MSKSAGERQETFQAGQRALNRVPRPVWATAEEHEEIKLLLAELRAKP